MRELVERRIDEQGRPAPAGRKVTVNVAESPLGWLAARGLVTPRQLDAGERLRADYERAQISPVTTMRWQPRVDGATGDSTDPGTARIAAKRRFDDAVRAVGPGLSDILWRIVCAGEAVPVAEKALGWPGRSGRLVLTLALDRLADHYSLR
ncbi:hypothetical protein GCM10011380_14300 [Sphingomonas metalli]|uniref:DUF6456 domain-containing protein n=1 Tax=Sphingomonas metalli TaxID=1779358 RepID=A0A916T0R6_9SPHN|nr:DUF6456 domain-containing protein [Sphingomonas metalli]GGB25846.1 hypothetical protein GCM10011380_14300 [Sphingomonas metalli]